ncbi:DNA internalization-related competence protein ComEC/Rec2 [Agathobacter sp.]
MFALVYTAGTVARITKWYAGWLAFLLCMAVLLCECAKVKDKAEAHRKKLICLFCVCVILFAVAQIRYDTKESFSDSYMQELTDESSVVVWGKIYKTEYKNHSYRYYITGCSAQTGNKKFRCNDIIVYSDENAAGTGSYIMAEGKVSLFKEATNEGEFDRKEFYWAQMIDFAVNADSIESREGRFSWFYHRIDTVKDVMVQSLLKVTDEKTAGILSSMILGDKTYLDDEIKDLYQVTGISHILAISGLHISIVGMAFYRLLRKRKMSYMGAFVCAGTLIVCYACMTGNAVSTKRAVGMFMLVMIAAVFGRTADMLNSLGVMVIYILWNDPFVMGYAGFVFSAGAILSIGIVVPLMTGKKKNRLWTSVAIQLPMLPVVAFNYFEIPLYAVFVNLIVIPVLPVIFISGLAAAGILWIFGMVGIIPAKIAVFPAYIILRLYELLCQAVVKLPGASVITGHPSWSRLVVFYMALSLFLLWFARLLRKKSENMIKWNLIRAACTVILIFVLIYTPAKPAQMDILDVGQGDGICYRFSSGDSIFIDGGSTDRKKIGENVILPFLKYNGIEHISYWFVSHADQDHISGIAEIIESGYEIDNIVVAKAASGDEPLDGLISTASDAGINVCYMSAGDVVIMPGNNDKSAKRQIKCLYPGNDDASEDRNNMSLVLKIEDEEFSGIFAGDIPSEVEQELVKRHGDSLDADFYKSDHHGSKYSNSSEWLEAISPKWTAVSCAEQNRYGHPADEAIERIENSNSRIFYTMKSGQIKYKESAVYENNRQ